MKNRRRIFVVVAIAFPVFTGLALLAAWLQMISDVTPSSFKSMFKKIVVASKSLDKGIDAIAYGENWAKVTVLVPMPYTGLHYSPNVRGDYVNTNDLGLRGTTDFADMIAAAASAKASGSQVVTLSGGSAMFGAYSADDDRSISSYLNKLAAKFGRAITVFNFGMGNYTTEEELASQLFYMDRLDPDLIVVMDGYADTLRVSNKDYNFGSGIPLGFGAIRDSYPVAYESRWLDRQYRIGNPKDLDAWRDNYAENLKRMALVARAAERKILLSVQPIKFAWGKFDACRTLPDKALEYIELLLHAYPKVVETAKKAAKESGARFANLHETFADQDSGCPFFADNVHMNSRGQKLLAARLFPAVLEATGDVGLSESERRSLDGWRKE